MKMTIDRFIEANNGTGFIHKSKLNTNGTFSVGKTWKISELRAIQVVDVCVCRMLRMNRPPIFSLSR